MSAVSGILLSYKSTCTIIHKLYFCKLKTLAKLKACKYDSNFNQLYLISYQAMPFRSEMFLQANNRAVRGLAHLKTATVRKLDTDNTMSNFHQYSEHITYTAQWRHRANTSFMFVLCSRQIPAKAILSCYIIIQHGLGPMLNMIKITNLFQDLPKITEIKLCLC